jgi:lysophospholipid hydrolase
MTSTAQADVDFRMESAPKGDQELLFEIKVSQITDPWGRNAEIDHSQPGGIAGYLAALSSSESYTTIRAKTDCYVGLLPHQSFERLLERRPIVLLTLAKRLTSVLSPLGKYLP